MSWQILQSDVTSPLPLKDNSVQCVVTSPPYWGLRDYGTASWAGGDAGCDHKGSIEMQSAPGSAKQASNRGANGVTSGNCKCGATRIDRQLGLEATPELYVERMVAVFREIKRVLRDDGTVWCNLGDSYVGGNQGGTFKETWTSTGGSNSSWRNRLNRTSLNMKAAGLKPKDLVGIPWRCAFALQSDGWYLRSDIIWSKPNPMPESVTDRPTKAHEYIFLLTKSPNYYFDQDAVREKANIDTQRATPAPNVTESVGNTGGNKRSDFEKNRHTVESRNIRTVWEIATQPYPEAHFATFPEAIAERCIKAGTSEKGACSECGAPWERVTDRKPALAADGKTCLKCNKDHGKPKSLTQHTDHMAGNYAVERFVCVESTTLGWQPTCTHDAPATPCVVLDPFSGAGTTALVADKLGRFGIGLELKLDYCQMASRRCYDDAPLLSLLG